ncbi:MAG: Gfo/Idh/MocA family protein [bacterium]
MKTLLFTLSLFCFVTLSAQNHRDKQNPVRLAVAGISHGHNSWILGRKNDDAVMLVGIYEADTMLINKAIRQFNLSPSLFFTDINKMLKAVKPEGVVAFGSTFDHLSVVEACAPMGVHVMVEKPLATTVDAAETIAALSKKHKVHVLTNFETSWYPTTAKTYQLTRDPSFMGKIRKVVVHDGHQGPKEIGVSDEFFNWLTDPVLNGGGALMDFGCYGANLITNLMNGQMPTSVTAVTQQFKPQIYPKVDDEATIMLTYPTAQCIIQASWNWPFSRKDMAVYGEDGYIITADDRSMKAKGKVGKEDSLVLSAQETGAYTSPFLYFADVIRERIEVPSFGLYSLENNLMVVKILEAARNSAREGKTFKLTP